MPGKSTAAVIAAVAVVGALVLIERGYAGTFGPGLGLARTIGWSPAGAYGHSGRMMGGPRGNGASGGAYVQPVAMFGGWSVDDVLARAGTAFANMDANRDGVLSRDEFMAGRMGPGAGRNQARQAERMEFKAARFDAMDANHDGKVGRDEFLAAARARFAGADANGDGRIDRGEMRRLSGS